MATIYRCDKCHQEYTNRSDIEVIHIPHVSSFRTFEDIERYNKDLCAGCWFEIIKEITEYSKRR